MSAKVMSLAEAAKFAAEKFGAIGGVRASLVQTGLSLVDEEVGGLDAGTTIVIAADQGVGKSRLALSAAMEARRAGKTWGLISLEDGPDVVGSRVLAAAGRVPSRELRLGSLSKRELESVRKTLDELLESDVGAVPVAFALGGSISDVESAIDGMADAGADGVWVDYVQKIRGIREQRSAEVAEAFSRIQSRCWKRGLVGGVLSQVTAVREGTPPTAANIRDSRDLANEARVIVVAWREADDVIARLEKCSFGRAGSARRYRTRADGMLEDDGPWHPSEEQDCGDGEEDSPF